MKTSLIKHSFLSFHVWLLLKKMVNIVLAERNVFYEAIFQLQIGIARYKNVTTLLSARCRGVSELFSVKLTLSVFF